jgi:voltage-gated potassium channel
VRRELARCGKPQPVVREGHDSREPSEAEVLLSGEGRADDERTRIWEARFAWPMIVAALLVIPLIFIEQTDPGQPWETIGSVLNWLTWLAFLTELVVMLRVSRHPLTWLKRHPLDAFVVVLSPPFLPGGLAAARLFRLLRVLRLFRLFSIRQVVSLNGIRYAAFLVVCAIVVGGVAFSEIENDQAPTAWDGIWWAVTTVTTVGSDISPATTGGRLIAIAIMVVGISFVALLTGFLADRFIRHEVEEDAETHEKHVLERLEQIDQRLQRLERTLDGGNLDGGKERDRDPSPFRSSSPMPDD